MKKSNNRTPVFSFSQLSGLGFDMPVNKPTTDSHVEAAPDLDLEKAVKKSEQEAGRDVRPTIKEGTLESVRSSVANKDCQSGGQQGSQKEDPLHSAPSAASPYDFKSRGSVRRVCVNIVWDGTLSMSKYRETLNRRIQKGFGQLRNDLNSNKAVEMAFGILVFTEKNGRPVFEQLHFGGKEFTTNIGDVINAITRVEYSGGDVEDGRERSIVPAIRRAIANLEEGALDESALGIMFFTDSLPKKDENNEDDEWLDFSKDQTRKMRFAYFYMYDNSYIINLSMAGQDGTGLPDDKNVSIVYSLNKLLGDDGADEFYKMLRGIYRQVSVPIGGR